MAALAEDVGNHFAFVFKSFSHLHRLTRLVILNAESLFSTCPTLVDLLLTLTTIENLEMSDIGESGAMMLQGMQSKVKHATLSFRDAFDSDDDSSDWDAQETEDQRNPLLLLHSSQDTLESLTTIRSMIPAQDMPTEVYPLVKMLEARDADNPDTAILAHAYPKLRHLHFESDRESPEEYERPGEHGVQVCMELNAVNKLKQANSGTWEGLDSVSASLLDHFVLGIQCPVKDVTICGPHMDTFLLRNVLRPARPRSLYLRGYDGDVFDAKFAKLMARPYMVDLECFEAMLMLGGVVEPTRVDPAATLVRNSPGFTP